MSSSVDVKILTLYLVTDDDTAFEIVRNNKNLYSIGSISLRILTSLTLLYA